MPPGSRQPRARRRGRQGDSRPRRFGRRGAQDRRQIRLRQGVHLQPPHHPAHPDADQWCGPRQCADEDEVSPPTGNDCRGTINNCGTGYTPWGTFLTAKKTGPATSPAGHRRRRTWRRHGKSVVSLRALWPRPGCRQPPRLGDLRHRRQVCPLEHQPDRHLHRRHRRLPQRAQHLRLHRRDRPLRQDGRPSASAPAGPLCPRERCFRQAGFRQAAGGLHGRRLAWRIHLQVCVHRQLGRRRRNPANRITTGDKYLDSGKLYVAKFNADGTASGSNCR
jgi:hypothetical protein